MLKIIPYRETEHYGKICTWWFAAGESCPTRDMMPEASSFVLTAKGKPWVAVTVYLTNSAEIAWVDNLVSNPKMPKGKKRAAAVKALQEFLEAWAAEMGYKKLFCMASKPALAKRYASLGYTETLSGVKTFAKVLKAPLPKQKE